MAAVLPFKPRELMLAPLDPLDALSAEARAEAQRCLGLIRPALQRMAQGVSKRAAAAWLAQQGGDMPSLPTLQRWLAAYERDGLVGLAPKYKGRVRKEYGWEATALELFGNRPTQPHYSTVAMWLREKHGFENAADHLVRRYLQSLPSNLTETAPGRLGRHYYQQNVKPYVLRDNTVLPVGFIYEGDGHCCDVYVASPRTGNAYRPELTVWVDVRSHFVVGWYLSESESANTTLFSLSHALLRHDHVPAMLHADVGSGYVAKTISDQRTGFLARFSIEPIYALPGNAKGKGLIEGFWRWFEERCGKQFPTFCGHDRTDDYLRHLSRKVERGLIRLPTLAQYADACREYFDFYNRNHQKNLGCAPKDLWAELNRVPVETPAAAIMRPCEKRMVRRWGIALHNRIYRSGDLARYEGREVNVRYDLHNDMVVWIEDAKGRLIGEAKLVEKHPWLPDSRIEEAQQKRLEGQAQRLENKLVEFQGRAKAPLTGAAMLDALDDVHFLSATPSTPAPVSYLRPIDPEISERVTEAIAEAGQHEETPTERYQRWVNAEAELAAGQALPPELQTWFDTYQTSSEWRSFDRLRSTFGAVSGVVFPSP
ncbi:transposase [Stagnimonas aquatica]|uniref:Transposase n=1 Tax=Stagnimonas aquatica TaxID=2689987 RepID=A0A3N0V7I5_9GAMM|nr:Mu transposase C-terminal domain-containing protein [Stagnimonas aquatica]ROH88645.1 transposase [Stagnimonas aquatica]